MASTAAGSGGDDAVSYLTRKETLDSSPILDTSSEVVYKVACRLSVYQCLKCQDALALDFQQARQSAIVGFGESQLVLLLCYCFEGRLTKETTNGPTLKEIPLCWLRAHHPLLLSLPPNQIYTMLPGLKDSYEGDSLCQHRHFYFAAPIF